MLQKEQKENVSSTVKSSSAYSNKKQKCLSFQKLGYDCQFPLQNVTKFLFIRFPTQSLAQKICGHAGYYLVKGRSALNVAMVADLSLRN